MESLTEPSLRGQRSRPWQSLRWLRRDCFASLAMTILAALISYGTLFLVFSSSLRSQKEVLREKEILLRDSKSLLSQKKELVSEWETKKISFGSSKSPEENLNAWVKELLTHGSSQGLVFSKLEPQGVKEKEGGKEIRLLLSFEGDILKLARFLYFLLGKDPLSRVESFVIKEEEAKKFSYELTLGRALL